MCHQAVDSKAAGLVSEMTAEEHSTINTRSERRLIYFMCGGIRKRLIKLLCISQPGFQSSI